MGAVPSRPARLAAALVRHLVAQAKATSAILHALALLLRTGQGAALHTAVLALPARRTKTGAVGTGAVLEAARVALLPLAPKTLVAPTARAHGAKARSLWAAVECTFGWKANSIHYNSDPTDL